MSIGFRKIEATRTRQLLAWYLLIGLVTTIGLALVIAARGIERKRSGLYVDQSTGLFWSMSANTGITVVYADKSDDRPLDAKLAFPELHTPIHSWRWDAPPIAQQRSRALPRWSAPFTSRMWRSNVCRVVAIGWPEISFAGAEWESDGGSSAGTSGLLRHPEAPAASSRSVKMLIPYRPIWYGLALSSLFWAVCIGIIHQAYRWLRKTVRGLNGCCTQCGYSLDGLRSSTCPECGSSKETAGGMADVLPVP
jgi:hypothetical protein